MTEHETMIGSGTGSATGNATQSSKVDDALAGWGLAADQTSVVIQLNQLGYTERLIRAFGDELMFVPGIGWHTFRNHIWQLDELDNALELTKQLLPMLQHELVTGQLADGGEYRAAIRGVAGMQTRAQVARALTVDSRVKVPATGLNANPWLLATRSGTLDLRTGDVRPGTPADRITQRADVEVKPEATCPRFDALLAHAFGGDPVMISYVWRVLGYCLTGVASEQVFFFMWGVPGSSKSTIAEVMVHLLGDYAQWLDEAALTGGAEQHPTWIADLLGKRFIVKDELDGRKRINTARVNSLTAGVTQRGRKMGKDFIDIPIHAKLMITTNHRPPMGSAQDGVWRRIQPVRFRHKIGEDQKIKNYGALLAEEEGAGILNGCLRGLLDYLGGPPDPADTGLGRLVGLRSPQAVVDDADAYRVAEDEHGPFITDYLVNTGDAGDWVANADLRAVYDAWCDDNGVKPVSGIELGKMIAAAQFEPSKTRRARHRLSGQVKPQRGWLGMKLAVAGSGVMGDAVAWQSTVTEPG